MTPLADSDLALETSKPALTGLTRRAEFLRAAKGRRVPAPAFLLQAVKRPEDSSPGGPRVGFTCSKKVGNAVARNRAKRRLRAAARLVLPDIGRPGWDYVLIGRAQHTASRPFDALVADLRDAVAAAHAPAGKSRTR